MAARAGLMRPLAPCTAPGCPTLVAGGGRCPEHQRPAWQSGQRPQLVNSGRWKKLRGMVLRRDGHRCQICGAPATQVDHVVSRADGGSDDPANLRAICSDCHGRRTGAQGARAAVGRR